MQGALALVVAALALASAKHVMTPLQVELPSEGVACYAHEDCLSSEMCERKEGARSGICVFQGEVSDKDLQQEMGAQVLTAAGLNVSSLTINCGKDCESKITMGEGAAQFTLAVSDGKFVIRHGSKDTFTVDSNGNIAVLGKLHTKGALRVDGQLQYMGLSQWFLAVSEDFNKPALGWTNTSTEVCGSNKKMLGGYGKFAGGEVHKTFRNLLAAHKELRLKANFHYIDSWEGETAYAKLNNMYVWADTYDHTTAKAGINICGATAAEGKFAAAIDVVIPHNTSIVTVTFGATLDQSPYDESWGVDDVMIMLR